MDKYLILEIVGGLVLLPVRVGTPPWEENAIAAVCLASPSPLGANSGAQQDMETTVNILRELRPSYKSFYSVL